MFARNFFGVVVAVLTIQSQQPTRGPAENGSPAWFMQGSFPDPGGNTIVDADGRVTRSGKDCHRVKSLCNASPCTSPHARLQPIAIVRKPADAGSSGIAAC
jgi:hypothetical protein